MASWYDRLNEVIKENNETPGSLSRKIGVSKPTTKDWTDGATSSPSGKNVEKICSHYGINSHWLMQGKPPKYTAGNSQDNYLTIPHFDAVEALANSATQQKTESVVEFVRINKQYLARKTNYTNPNNLAIITATGDSMSPTFNEGDMLIIDTGINTATSDAIYVISRNGALFIKRLMLLSGDSLRVISDNEKYRDHHYDITLQNNEDFHIHGRVLLAWNVNFI